MPYRILGNVDDSRTVVPDCDIKLVREFLDPIAFGKELTTKILSKKPDPYFVKPPRKGGMPEIFVGPMFVWHINDRAKKVIEELEPGVHTFVPVNLRVRGSNMDWGQYYILHPGQIIDAVVIDETDFAEGKGRAAFELSPTLSPFGVIVLDGRLIAGRHLWLDAETDLFCSDELFARISHAGLEGWRFQECKLK